MKKNIHSYSYIYKSINMALGIILLFAFSSKTLLLGQCNHFFSQLDGTSGTPNINLPFDLLNCQQYPSPLNALAEQINPSFCSPVSIRGRDTAYAVVVGGDYIIPDGGGAESEGRVAVLGNLINNRTASNYGISESGGGTFVVGAPGAYGLAIGGNLSGTGQVHVGQNLFPAPYQVRIGGSVLGGLAGPNLAIDSMSGSSGVNITDILTEMSAISSAAAIAAPTGTVFFPPFSSPAIFTGSNAAVEIFNVNGADLAGPGFLKDIEFRNIAPGATMIINVSGLNVTVGYRALVGRVSDPNMQGSDPDALVYHLAWNFHEATNITLKQGVDLNGMTMIPNGGIDSLGNVNGRLYIGGTLTHTHLGTEIHNYPFTGDLTSFCSSSPLPTKWKQFDVALEGQNTAVLDWTTVSELNNAGFEIEHALPTNGAPEFNKIDFIDGQGTTLNTKHYQYKVPNLISGVHYFRLRQVDFDGNYDYTPIKSLKIADNDWIDKLYPAVVDKSRATIFLKVVEDGAYTIDVINTLGQVVESRNSLLSAMQHYELNLDSSRYVSGVYYIRVRTATAAFTRKIQMK